MFINYCVFPLKCCDFSELCLVSRVADPDPVCPESLDPDPVCPERLDPDPDPVNIRPDPKP